VLMEVIVDRKNIVKLVNEAEVECENIFKEIDKLCEKNSSKVLDAFHKYNISETDFFETTGYGYNDLGREKIEKVFSYVLGGEDSLVRNQFISGTHALTVSLFGLLRPNDTMLSITGKPYDTLEEVIGIKENASSLKSYNINYEEIDLKDNDFNYEEIANTIKGNKIKLIEIQRSKGYSMRKSISIEKIEKVIKYIKKIDDNIIIFVDNCYCEMVEEKTPLEVGADIIVGSLIKNLGGSIAPNGAYVSGKKDLIELISERLTVPGQGKEVGPSQGVNKKILQGLFFAPSVVSSSLKVAILTSRVFEKLNIKVDPKYNEKRVDIVQNIIFEDENLLIKYCQGIQKGSPIDANVLPIASDMPGYDNKIIMASGSFTQGSSIELSCDGPLKEPFVAYQQGSTTYQYGKLGLITALENVFID